MPSTPEPTRLRAHTPPTPLHGPAYDTYQPYSPRRSTRSTAHTNPYSSFNTDRSPHPSASHTTPPPTAKRARFARRNTQLSSPPSSPASPARTRTVPPSQQHRTLRKVRTTVTAGAQPISDSDNAGPSSRSLAAPTIDPTTMLPTPSKTPRNKRTTAAISSAARILNFQQMDPNHVMPTPRKQRKHARMASMNGFDLYDGEGAAHQGGDRIEIFTDANARVPVMDEGEDNPFVGPKRRGRPQRRSRQRQEEEEEMEERVRREEGVVYVFRGKKIFRPFTTPDAEEDQHSRDSIDYTERVAQRTLRRQAGATAQRPLTRSSIKPRLLFPSEQDLLDREARDDDVDEEAATDIEMGNTHAVESTPVKSRHAGAATPPTTARATRVAKLAASPTGSTPIPEEDEEIVGLDDSFNARVEKVKKGKKSPFDSWARTKSGRKRVGSVAEGPGKRVKGAIGEGL